MICLALGLGILGFVAVRRARHFHHCYAYGGHHGGFGPPWSQWHGGHHGYSYGRRGLYMALARLDCSPAQERAIIHEIDHLRSKLRDTRYGLKDSRGDLAAALRGPVLDDAALGAVLGRVDAATGEPRPALTDLAGRGDVAVNERAVDVHISRLRKKLGDEAAQRIRTVRGIGYTLARSADERTRIAIAMSCSTATRSAS